MVSSLIRPEDHGFDKIKYGNQAKITALMRENPRREVTEAYSNG